MFSPLSKARHKPLAGSPVWGVIGAVADAAANEDNNVSDAEYLRDALGPRFQVEAFRSIDVSASLNLPEGTEVI